jgi:hypothetical protein
MIFKPTNIRKLKRLVNPLYMKTHVPVNYTKDLFKRGENCVYFAFEKILKIYFFNL